jgi:pyruvate carboxylase
MFDNKINRMQQSIDELSSKMSTFMASNSLYSGSVTQPASNSSSADDTALATSSAKPTCVQILSAKDISKAMEAAVAKSLVSHQKLEQQKAAAVMYGMYEYGNAT